MVNRIVGKDSISSANMETPSQREEIEAALKRVGYQPTKLGFEMLSKEIGLGADTIYKAWLGSSSLGKAALRQIQNIGYPAAEDFSMDSQQSAREAKAALDYIFTHADKAEISMVTGMIEAARRTISAKQK